MGSKEKEVKKGKKKRKRKKKEVEWKGRSRFVLYGTVRSTLEVRFTVLEELKHTGLDGVASFGGKAGILVAHGGFDILSG